ncbi:MAG: AI-2E family transporter [Collinsella sp.]
MNEHPQQSDRILRDTRILTLRIWAVVGCIVIAAVIFNLMGILAPVIEFLAVGSIIAFVMSPITNWLEHHGVGRGIGSLVALIVVVAVLVGVVCILSPILFGQIMEVLSRLPAQLRVAGGDLNEMISHAKTLNNTPLKEYLDENLSSLVTVASKYVSQIAAELGRGVFPLITNTASQLFVIFLGLVLAYWMACDYPRMHHEICTIIGQEKETSYRFMVAILSRSVGGYMRGMVVTSICGGFLAFIGFMIIGHPYAALMAIFTGIMHLVPVVGPWVSAAIATVLGFMFSPMLALWTLIVTMVAQNVTDNVISPKVMQSSVQVHPIMSLTALVIGSALMGPIGMIIAIPLRGPGHFRSTLRTRLTPHRRWARRIAMPRAIRSPPMTRLETIHSFTSPSSSATRLRPRPKRCLSPSSRIPGSSSRACSPMRRVSSRTPSPRMTIPIRTTTPKPASTALWTIRIPNRPC